ncbi:MAG: MSMEG_1061 family FMN-dependent PPOX-type flavoprotein [Saccharospirillum sp.]|uniref:MSMEG_1061 family FMN-dependent PPOX-type flavoprotein n=1 Tax=Saccharospirillum sp. TaxID=2033801 RepID=UPI003297B377
MKLTSEAALRDHYGHPHDMVRQKVLTALEVHSRQFLSLSPFMVMSTSNEQGQLDSSPRGGEPGFVKILDDTTLLIPDAKGNNRLDSLRNIVLNPSVGCLFLVPGIHETLRINGKAEIRIDDASLVQFSHLKQTPISVICVHIEEVFLHCARSLTTAELWDPAAQVERSVLPPLGKMIRDQIEAKSAV